MNKCNNCGKTFHMYKQCKMPIVSIGLINVNEQKRYLMICRKKTLGYVDFLCGKYSLYPIAHVMNLVDEMTLHSGQLIANKSIEKWACNLWIRDKKI